MDKYILGLIESVEAKVSIVGAFEFVFKHANKWL